jgi:Tyrosine-protein kinase ephrin type A/B receptor-like
MKSQIYFVTAVLCFLAGLWLQEASNCCLVHCISNLLSTLYAHLITGHQTWRTEALSIDTEESVGTSVQDNKLKLASYPPCATGYARYSSDRLCRKCDDGTYIEYIYAYPGDPYPFAQCTICPSGTYAVRFGAYECTPCPTGTTSPAGASSCTSSTSCAKGEYRKAGCACEKCLAGTYSDTLTASECTPCPIGQSSSAGASCCTPCAKGTYSPTAGSTCTSCPAGTYAGATGSSKCKKCTKGSSSSAGASSCTPCAKGYYSPKAGSICSPCCAGTYADCTGSVTCKKCPPGYTSEAGASSCKCSTKETYSAVAWSLFSV